jgi:hypothetical protein
MKQHQPVFLNSLRLAGTVLHVALAQGTLIVYCYVRVYVCIMYVYVCIMNVIMYYVCTYACMSMYICMHACVGVYVHIFMYNV